MGGTQRNGRRIHPATRTALSFLLSLAMVTSGVPMQAIAEVTGQEQPAVSAAEPDTQPAVEADGQPPTEGADQGDSLASTEEPEAQAGAEQVSAEQPSLPAFEQSGEVAGMQVGVHAPEGVFAPGSKLSVEAADQADADRVLAALRDELPEGHELASAQVIKLRVLSEGGEAQTYAKESDVHAVFANAQFADAELEPVLYAVGEQGELKAYDEVAFADDKAEVTLEGDELQAIAFLREVETKEDEQQPEASEPEASEAEASEAEAGKKADSAQNAEEQPANKADAAKAADKADAQPTKESKTDDKQAEAAAAANAAAPKEDKKDAEADAKSKSEAEAAAAADAAKKEDEEKKADEQAEDKTQKKDDAQKTTEQETVPASYPAFDQNQTVDGVTVRVQADQGAFPEGSKLEVKSVSILNEMSAGAAVDAVRDTTREVAASYTFDIKVVDLKGNEVQPKDKSSVHVSFATEEVTEGLLTTEVYHIKDDKTPVAEQLQVTESGDVATAKTESFSTYKLIFSQGKIDYEMENASESLESLMMAVQLGNTKLWNVTSSDGRIVVEGPAKQAGGSSPSEWKIASVSDDAITDDNPVELTLSLFERPDFRVYVTKTGTTATHEIKFLHMDGHEVTTDNPARTCDLTQVYVTGYTDEEQKALKYAYSRKSGTQIRVYTSSSFTGGGDLNGNANGTVDHRFFVTNHNVVAAGSTEFDYIRVYDGDTLVAEKTNFTFDYAAPDLDKDMKDVGRVMHPLVMHKGEVITADEIKEMLATAGIVHPTCASTTVTPDLRGKKTLAQTTNANGTVVADSYTAVNSGAETITLTCNKTTGCFYGAGQSGSFEWEVYVLDNVTANYDADQGGLIVNGLSEYSSYAIYKVQNANDGIENGELVKTFDASELTFRDLTNNTDYTVTQRDKAVPASAEAAPVNQAVPTALTIDAEDGYVYRVRTAAGADIANQGWTTPTHGKVTFTTGIAAGTNYRVYKRKASETPKVVETFTGATTHSFTGLDTGKEYILRDSSGNVASNNHKDWTLVISDTDKRVYFSGLSRDETYTLYSRDTPYELVNTNATATAGTLVLEGLDPYREYRFVYNDTYQTGYLTPSPDGFLRVENLYGGVTYKMYYRIKAIDASAVNGTTAVKTGASVPEYVSPNPKVIDVTKTTVTVRAEPGKEYSIDGGQTWTDASSRIFDDLSSGIYKVVEIIDGINFASPATYEPHVIDKDEAGNTVPSVTITKEPQTKPADPSVTASVTSVTITATADEVGQQYLVLPAGQTPTELDWHGKAVKVAEEAGDLVIDGLEQDTEYVVYTRKPGSSTLDPSPAASKEVKTQKFVELTDDTKPTIAIKRGEDDVTDNKPKVGDVLTASATACPVEYTWYYVDNNGNPTGEPIATGDTYTVQAADNGKRIVAVATQNVDESGKSLTTPKTATSTPTDAVTLKDNTTTPETGDIAVGTSTDTTADPATDTVTVKPTKGGYEYLVTTSKDAPSADDWANVTASTYYKETAEGENANGHVFTGLTTGVQYYVHVRQAATDDTNASPSSVVPAPPAAPNPASSAVDLDCLTETITPKEGYEIQDTNGSWIKAPSAIHHFEPGKTYQVRKAEDPANGIPASSSADYKAPERPAAPTKPEVTALDAVPGSATVSISVSPVNNAATYTVKDGSGNPVFILTPDPSKPGSFNVTKPDGSAADPATVTAAGEPASMTVGGLESNKPYKVEAIIAATVDTLASALAISEPVTTKKGTLDESTIGNNPEYQVKANDDPALVYDGNEHDLVKAPTKVPEGYTMQYGIKGDGGATTWSSELPKGTNAGEYKVYVKYAGDDNHDDLVLTDPITVTIAPKNINDATMTVSFDGTSFTYNGTEQGPTVTVKDGTTDLAKDADYELQEKPTATDAGDYTVKVVGKGNYTGEKSQGYSITKYDLADGDTLTVEFSTATFTFNGNDQRPAAEMATVKINSDVVPAGNYKLTFPEESINVGEYKVQVELEKNFSGSGEGKYTIAAKSIEEEDVTKTFAGTQFIYSGAEQGPVISVAYGTIALHVGTDYTVENQKNVDKGTYTAKVTGTGNYTGEVTQTYEIKPYKTSGDDKIIVTFPDGKDAFPYNGEVQKPAADGIVVKLNDTPLTKGTDYTITYSNDQSKDVGAYYVTITLSDNYDGEKVTQKGYAISSHTLAGITGSPVEFTYNENAQGPSNIVVTGSDNKTLTENTDYTLANTTETNAGTYKVIATGKGNYEGTVELEYTIKKAGQTDLGDSDKPATTTSTEGDKASITVNPSIEGQEYIVVAKGTTPTDDDWKNNAKDGNGGALVFGDLEPGTEYEVLTRKKGDDNHDPSNTAKTEVATTPAAPSVTDAVEISYPNETITAKEGYEILKRGADPAKPESWVSEISGNDFTPGGTYQARKKADAPFPASNPVAVTLASRPSAPEAPAVEAATPAIGESSVALNIKPAEADKIYTVKDEDGKVFTLTPDPSDPTGYKVTNKNGDVVNPTPITKNDDGSVTVGGLEPNKAYTVETVKQATENAPASEPATAGPVTTSKLQQATPGAPTTINEPTKITVTAPLSSDTVKYEYKLDNGEWTESPVFDNLTPGTAHTVKVRVKGDATHDPSSEASASVTTPKKDNGTPQAPSSTPTTQTTTTVDPVTHEERTTSSITIDPTAKGQEYIVVKKGTKPTEEDWQNNGQKSENGEALTFDGLEPETEYEVLTRLPGDDQTKPSDAVSTPVVTKPAAPVADDAVVVDYANEGITAKSDPAPGYQIFDPEADGGKGAWVSEVKRFEPNTDYDVRVAPKMEGDKEVVPASDAVKYHTPSRPATPDEPQVTAPDKANSEDAGKLTIENPADVIYTVKDGEGNVVETLTPDPEHPGTYNVTDKDGKPADPATVSKGEDGKLVIGGLEPNTQYSITAQVPATSTALASETTEPVTKSTPQEREAKPAAPGVTAQNTSVIINPADNGTVYTIKSGDNTVLTLTPDPEHPGTFKVTDKDGQPASPATVAKDADGKLTIGGLQPNTDYTVTATKQGAGDKADSEPSEPTQVKTGKATQAAPASDPQAKAGTDDQGNPTVTVDPSDKDQEYVVLPVKRGADGKVVPYTDDELRDAWAKATPGDENNGAITITKDGTGTDLKPGVEYQVLARKKGDADTEPSAPKAATVVTPPNPADAVTADGADQSLTPNAGYEVLKDPNADPADPNNWVKAPDTVKPFEPGATYPVRKAADPDKGIPASEPANYTAPAKQTAPTKPTVTAVDATPGEDTVSVNIKPAEDDVVYTIKDAEGNTVLTLTPDPEHPGTFKVTDKDGIPADPATVTKTGEGQDASVTVGGLEPNKPYTVDAQRPAKGENPASDVVSSSPATVTAKAKLDPNTLTDDNKPTAKSDLTYDGTEQPLVDAPKSVPAGCTMLYATSPEGPWTQNIPTRKDAHEDGQSTPVYVKYAGDEDHDDLVLEQPINVSVAKKAITDPDVDLASTEFIYSGTEQGPVVTVKVDGRTLTAPADYAITGQTATNKGTHTVKVEGTGNYTGTVEKTYTINPYKTSDTDAVTVAFGNGDDNFTYDGADHRPDPANVIVKLNGTELVQGTDYDLVYPPEGQSVETGGYEVKVVLKGNYEGETAKDYVISPADASTFVVEAKPSEFVYSGEPQGPVVTVKSGSTVLIEGTDYDLSGATAIDKGEYQVTIVAKGNYSGTTSADYKIDAYKPGANDKVDITFPDGNKDAWTYDGTDHRPAADDIKVTLNGKELKPGEDYDLVYSAPEGESVNAGSYDVKVVLKGNYASEGTDPAKGYKIEPKKLTADDVTFNPLAFDYNGEPQGPNVTVKDGNKVLEENVGYTAVGRLATDANTYQVTVKGTGNYTGTVVETYVINKATGSATTLTDGQKAAPVSPTPVYDGNEHTLVAGPTAEPPAGYTKMQYATSPDGPWSDELPKGTDAGDYPVYTKYVGDKNHDDLIVNGAENPLPARIAPAPEDKPAAPQIGEPSKDSVEVVKPTPGVVYQLLDGEGKVVKEATGGEDGSNIVFAGLDPNSNYTVSAYTPARDGNHADSEPATAPAHTLSAAPAAGEGYEVDYPGQTMTIEPGYEVRATSPAGTEPTTWAPNDSFPADKDGRTVIPVVPGATYEIRKKEVTDGQGKVKEHESAPMPFTLPAAPVAKGIDDDAISATDTTLTVNPTTKGQQYAVVPANATDEQIAAALDGNGAKTSQDGEALTFDGLDPNTEYKVVTRTPAQPRGEDGTPAGSFASKPVSADARTLQTAPVAGEGYDIDYANETVTPKDGYEVLQKNDDGTEEWVKAPKTIPAKPGEAFQVRKAATDSEPESMPTTNMVPPRPTATALPASNVNPGDTSVLVTGSKAGQQYIVVPANATPQQIEDAWKTAKTATTDQDVMTFDGLTPDTAYQVITRVPAKDGAFKSEPQATPFSTKPSAPAAGEGYELDNPKETITIEDGYELIATSPEGCEPTEWTAGPAEVPMTPGATYEVRKKADPAKGTQASDPTSFTAPERRATPKAPEVTTAPAEAGEDTLGISIKPVESDVVYTVKDEDGNTVRTVTPNDAGGFDVTDKDGNKVGTVTPGEDGGIVVSGLEPNKAYTVTAQRPATGDQLASEPVVSDPVTVGKGDISTAGFEPTAKDGLSYNGKEQHLVTPSATLPEGAQKVQYSTDGGKTWSDEVPTATDAGDYEVLTKFVGDATHNDAIVGPVKVTMGPREVAEDGSDGPAVAYLTNEDGNVVDKDGKPLTEVTGEDGSKSYVDAAGNPAVPAPSVMVVGTNGESEDNIQGMLGSVDDERYKVSTPVYDANAHKPMVYDNAVLDADGNPTPLVEGKDYTVAYYNPEDIDPATGLPKLGAKPLNTTDPDADDYAFDAGERVAVITFQGNHAGTLTAPIKVNKRVFHVKTADASKVYDGTPLEAPKPTVWVEGAEGVPEGAGLVNGQQVEVVVTGSQTAAGTSKNTYTIHFKGEDEESQASVAAAASSILGSWLLPRKAFANEANGLTEEGQKPTAKRGNYEEVSEAGTLTVTRATTPKGNGTTTTPTTSGTSSSPTSRATVPKTRDDSNAALPLSLAVAACTLLAAGVSRRREGSRRDEQ